MADLAWLVVGGSLLVLVAAYRAAIQPDEPFYKWGIPVGWALMFLGIGLVAGPIFVAGVVVSSVSHVCDFKWRTENTSDRYWL